MTALHEWLATPGWTWIDTALVAWVLGLLIFTGAMVVLARRL